MVSMAAKTSLVLCIIEAVASVPQLGQFQGFLGSVAFPDSSFNQHFRPSASSQHSVAPLFAWSRITNGCITGKNDHALEGINSLDVCQNHCQVQTSFLCRSVEYNTRGRQCILSRFTSRTTSDYVQPCPTHPNNWVYSELVEIVSQRPVQNNIQSPRPVQDRFQDVGLSPSQQNGVRPPNPATARPLNTNPNQQVSHTAQQSGLPATQQGKPQNQQNGANQANAASSGLDHFTSPTHRPAAQSTSHNGNQQQQQHQQTQQQQPQPQHQQNQHQQQPQHQQPQNQQTQHQQTNPQQNQQTQHQQTQHHQSQVPGAATGATSGPPGTSGATSGSGQKKPDRCHRIPSPGECRGAFPRFFYNETLDQCDCFLYGGCGNEALESSWLTNAECNDICHPGNVEEGPRCKLLPKQDIQTFTQPSIIKPFDTSNITDTELLDKLNNSNNKGQ